MMRQASAGGNTMPVIARLVQTDEDTLLDAIHKFNQNPRHPHVLAAHRRERAQIRSEKSIRWGGRPLTAASSPSEGSRRARTWRSPSWTRPRSGARPRRSSSPEARTTCG
ncbi:hypothetical protein ABZW95_34085, partial [Streptomyces sp. NPDC004579]